MAWDETSSWDETIVPSWPGMRLVPSWPGMRLAPLWPSSLWPGMRLVPSWPGVRLVAWDETIVPHGLLVRIRSKAPHAAG